MAARVNSLKYFASREDGGVAGPSADEVDKVDALVRKYGQESPSGGAECGGVDFSNTSNEREDGSNGRRCGRDVRSDGRDGPKSRSYLVNRGKGDGMHDVEGGWLCDGANWNDGGGSSAKDASLPIAARLFARDGGSRP